MYRPYICLENILKANLQSYCLTLSLILIRNDTIYWTFLNPEAKYKDKSFIISNLSILRLGSLNMIDLPATIIKPLLDMKPNLGTPLSLDRVMLISLKVTFY